MLKAEEVASFLDKAQRMSAEWTAQVQFMRDEFIPQIETLNQNLLERSHVPEISREILTAFMLKSNEIGKYFSRHLAIGGYGGPVSVPVHEKINSTALMNLIMPSVAIESLGQTRDLAFYFDDDYKGILLGHKNSAGGQWRAGSTPVRIYTNYDFFVELSVIKFQEIYCPPGSNYSQVAPVPLSGDNVTRDQFRVTFHPLGVPARPVVDPNPAELKAFLAQRKPFIHPVIVLDYIRKQDLPVVSAFFSDVAQFDLASTKNALDLRGIEVNIKSAEIAELKKSAKTDAARIREMHEAHTAQQEEIKQQRTKLNAAALRIKKLEMKLKQSEQMYEDLQMRLIENEGLDDLDIGDLNVDDNVEEDASIQTDTTRTG